MEEAGDQTRIVTTFCHQRSLITDFIHHPVTTKNQPSLRMLGINKNHRKNPDSQLQRLCYPQIEKSTNWQTHIFRDTVDGRHLAPPRMFKTLKIMR